MANLLFFRTSTQFKINDFTDEELRAHYHHSTKF